MALGRSLTSSHDKVEEPLSGGTDGHVHGTQASRRDLRHENPAGRAPAELEKSSPEIDAGNGDISEGRDLFVMSAWQSSSRKRASRRRATYWLALDGWLHSAVDADDVQHNGQGTARPQQSPAATERISNEEEEHGAGRHLDDAVDARGEERRVGAGHAQVLEDLRGVVVLRSSQSRGRYRICQGGQNSRWR